ncbi:carboxypeptidase-like regulatory domain-containing protein [Flavobacterium sp.]|uniref:carboxypeptidase-like regulatory domain-containing protein n=1 Tax=Flavobacterium sp. TaxID=239 RepID=UPI002FD9EF95
MNKLVFFLLVCGWFFPLSAQNISGKIADESNNPLYGVSIYFDGTTLGTTTNADGFFELKLQSQPNAILVISYLGYKTVYLNDFQSPIAINLVPETVLLKGVTLEPVPFSRKEMLDVFREQFLGKTKGGRNCEIENEEAIQFTYESKNFTLGAFADQKLRIKNKYLGYSIEVDLIDFKVQYNKRTLSNDFLRGSFFAITSFFQEWPTATQSFEKNRRAAYNGSPKHFFKNLIEKKWSTNEFILFEGSMPTDANLHFKFEEVQQIGTRVQVLAKTKQTNLTDAPRFYRTFSVLYNNKEQSKIIFKTAEFYVDDYGNHSAIDQIDFSGELSKRRMGDMLPLDYLPR